MTGGPASTHLRALRAVLLILAVFFGQSHLCRAVYVMPDGRDCPTCPYTPCLGEPTSPVVLKPSSASKVASIGAKDCRTCCKLTCREDGRPKTSIPIQAPDTVGVALPAAEVHVPTQALIVRENVSHEVRAQLPNAPPSHGDSRAPPASFV